jgi:hypothetical protein
MLCCKVLPNTKKQTTVADNEAKMAKQKIRCMTEDLGIGK